jgi:hypothetical protein
MITTKSCKVKITCNDRVIKEWHSLNLEYALEDAKKTAIHYRAKQAFQPVTWSVSWSEGTARNEIWDVIK